MNCSGGLTMTKAPERWGASWGNNLEEARILGRGRLEFILPVARWQAIAARPISEGTALERWAAGLLAEREN